MKITRAGFTADGFPKQGRGGTGACGFAGGGGLPYFLFRRRGGRFPPPRNPDRRERRVMSGRWAARLLVAAFLALSSLAAGNSSAPGGAGSGGCGSSSGGPDPVPPRLSSLRVTGAGEMRPAFAPEVFHYALRCEERQTLSVSAEAEGGGGLLLNGRAADGGLADARVRLAGDEDLVVEVSGPGTDERTAYVVHCVPPDFPDVEIVSREPGTAPGLLLVTPYYSLTGGGLVSYLAMLDENGVPRFSRRVSPGAHNFRWHERARRYSYSETRPNGAGDVVLLDESLEEVGRAGTVGGLAPAMMHDFLITDEGSYLFIVNNPVERDLSRYPVREGEPAPSSAQATHDSVIQEVSPDGREVFRWNSWDHLKLSDCNTWRLFPREYAKLNSISLSEGNIVASFRACSQVLRIERPSGRVLWQLGGSDPAAPDVHDGRRPVFERPWYRVEGDPRGGFCAQHATLEPAPGRVLMFDNGQCPGGDRPSSRVVEYRLGPGGEASFVRHHESGRLAAYAGAVSLLPNGSWLVAWGGSGPGPALSEVDASGRELFSLRLFKGPHPATTYRAYRHTGPEPPLRPPRSAEAAEDRPGTPGAGDGRARRQ